MVVDQDSSACGKQWIILLSCLLDGVKERSFQSGQIRDLLQELAECHKVSPEEAVLKKWCGRKYKGEVLGR